MTRDIADISLRLDDPSPEVRRRAVGFLRVVEGDGVSALLLKALADDDWRVRKECISVIGAVDADDAFVEQLIEGFVQERNVGLRAAASEALAVMGDRALGAVSRRLVGLDAGGRKVALEVIGSGKGPGVEKTLIASLDDDDPNVRVAAAELLSEHRSVVTVDALTQRLAGNDSLLTLAALQSLNQMGTAIPWESLAHLADNPIFMVEVPIAMARTGEPAAAKFIARLLTEELSALKAMEVLHEVSHETALAVEEALTDVGPEVIDHLVKLCGEHDQQATQRMCIRCIAWAKRKDQIPLLIDLARSDVVHPVVLESLRRWGDEAVVEVENMLARVQGRQLASAVGVLARLMDVDSGREKVALFSAYLNSGDIVVATAAAGAVARFGDEAVVPRLIELASSDDVRARRASGHALVQIGMRYPETVRSAIRTQEIEGDAGIEICRVYEVVGKPMDVGYIAGALNSPSPGLRRAVLTAVSTIAGSTALDTISLAMTDEDPGVQLAAAAALARIGSAASETIVSALYTADGPLKAALVKALGQVGHPEADAILRPLYGESTDVALAAMEAMLLLDLDLGEMKKTALVHKDAEVVKKALDLLGVTVSSEELLSLLDHVSWDVRLAAVERLARLVDETNVLASLRVRLTLEEDDLVRAAISRILPTAGERE